MQSATQATHILLGVPVYDGAVQSTSIEPALFDRMFAVNVRAPFFLIQEAILVMRREGIAGNIGSMSALAGQPFIAAYCASKGALATPTRNTAYGLLRNRIRVNGLKIPRPGLAGA
jgi:NAD(P)-dependent dehydrogenase (short-subunit alcohol dehydrogenase family)